MSERDIPSVTNLIAERIKSGSQPGNRRDPFKIGGVIEGGAMRGIVGGGACVAGQGYKLFYALDSLYTASSGSCSGFYTASEQAALGATIYYEDLVKGFIDVRRLLRGQPVVDIRYLTHTVMKDRKPLFWQKVIDFPVPIHTYATSAVTGKAVDLYPFSCREDIYDAMRRSCTMPFWAGMPKVEDDFLMDGATSTGGISYKEAIADGCTHILGVLTRPQGVLKGRSLADLIVVAVLFRHGYPAAARAHWQAAQQYNQTVSLMEVTESQVGSACQVKLVRPKSSDKPIASFEIRSSELFQGAQSGFNAMRRVFADYELPYDPQVQLIKP